MAYEASEQDRERKLRAVESASASAVLNGCDPEEVRRRVEVGLAEAVALNARRPGQRLADVPNVPQARAASPLDDWARAVSA